MPPRPKPSLAYSGTRPRAREQPRADDLRCRNQLLQLLPPAVMARLTPHLESGETLEVGLLGRDGLAGTAVFATARA